jgi:hypothetical protein
MGYPVTYLSGNSSSFELGMFKRGTVGQNQAATLTGNYRWWNGIDVTSSQYLIYSDSFTTSATTSANATPAAWATPDLNDISLINLINTLPERVGKIPFTYLPSALYWLQNTGRYFLLKDGYENITTNGLVLNLDAGWYLSYSGTGTNWKDLTTNNRNGTLINGPTFSNGNLRFDYADDYVSFSNLPSSTSYTVSCWFSANTGNWNGALFGFGTGGSPNTQDVYLFGEWASGCPSPVGGSFGYNTWNCDSWGFGNASSILKGTGFHHVVATFNNQDLGANRLWLDGVEKTLTQQIGTTQFSANLVNQFKIASNGWHTNDQLWNGIVSTCQVYNRILTPTEIVQNYNTQKTRFGLTAETIVTSGLTINLDAGNVISYPGSGTSWYDISGSACDGTLNNGIIYSSLSGGTMILDGIDDSVSTKNLQITSGQAESNITYEYWVEPQDVIYNGYTESTSGTRFYRPGSSATKQGLQSNLSYLYTCDTSNPYYNTKAAFGFALGTNGFVVGAHQCAYAPPILVDYKTITGTKHLVVIKRGNNVSYYLNGVKQKDSLTISKTIGDGFGLLENPDGSGGPIQEVTATFNNAFTTFFKGNIYSYRVYLRELSESEILQNYNAQKSRYGL